MGPSPKRPNRPRTEDLFARPPIPAAVLDDRERLACLRLIRSENIGPATFRALINQYGGAGNAIDALPELARRGGSRKPIRICPEDQAQREIEAARRLAISMIFTVEPGYPQALAALDQPPPLLYVKGQTEFLNKTAVAVVGSRRCSAAGSTLARTIAGDLGRQGLVIVSGLARGIDGAAHEAALASGTVAVLAGGLDSIYPPEHKDLQERIARLGCLVSEQPPGFVPRAKDFPRRNRIISGLSIGILVIEAARRSGSLTTARLAAEQGRTVYAIPGHPLDPRAEGTNELLMQGAQMARNAEDILRDLQPIFRDQPITAAVEAREPEAVSDLTMPPPLPVATTPPPAAPSDLHEIILAALSPVPVTIDQICRSTGAAAHAVQPALLELMLAGRIEQHGQNLVSLCPPAQPRD